MADQTSGAAAGGVHDDLQRVKADLAALRADIAALTGTAAEQAKAMGRERLEQMKAAMAAAKEKGGAAVEGAQQKIEEHPWTAVAIAFGVGFALGKLLDRK